MNWSLFGLGRRMFEENLYDAIPSITELFLLSFHSWAVEGSVFLLVQKHWRSWHHHSPLQGGMPWDSAGSFNSLCQWIYIFFFPYCSSWLFLLCGRWVCEPTMSLWLSSQCSLWKAAGQVGGPSCPSGAPLMSQCLSMGLRGHVHKAVQSHLFMARDTHFESGWASFAKILSKLWGSGEFCLFFQACWVVWGFGFVWLSQCWFLFRPSGNQNYHWFHK